MDLIRHADTSTTAPAPVDHIPPVGSPDNRPGWFVDCDLDNGVLGTPIMAQWANMVQAELRNAVTRAGLTPSYESWTQLADAIEKLAREAPVATAAAAGRVRLATDAEAQAGALATVAVTPASLASRTATTTRTGLVRKATVAEAQAMTADAFLDGALLSAAFGGANLSFSGNSGYQRLPNGVLLQWGIGVLPSANCPVGAAAVLGNITFPIAFPSGVKNVQALTYGPSSTGIEHTEVRLICEGVNLTSFGLSGFRHAGAFAAGEVVGFFWFAIGG